MWKGGVAKHWIVQERNKGIMDVKLLECVGSNRNECDRIRKGIGVGSNASFFSRTHRRMCMGYAEFGSFKAIRDEHRSPPFSYSVMQDHLMQHIQNFFHGGSCLLTWMEHSPTHMAAAFVLSTFAEDRAQ